jgi:ferritin-like metal-binding protein YciE
MNKEWNPNKNRERAETSKAGDGGHKTRHTEDDNYPEQMNNPLHEVFLEEIADIYNAEKQFIKALPKIVEAAESGELRDILESHFHEAAQHVQRLEAAVERLGESMMNKKCRAMEGLLIEAKQMIDDHKGQASLDAVLIAALQKVEHYEIATYGTLAAWARQMGHQAACDLFNETLLEEKAADSMLTEVAEKLVNVHAAAQD